MKKKFTIVFIVLMLSTAFIYAQTISTFPYTQGFEDAWVGTPDAPPDWEVPGGSGSYDWEQTSSYVRTGTKSALIYAYYTPPVGLLITPPIDLDASTAGLEVKFWARVYSTSYACDISVVLSTTDTAPASFTEVVMAPTTITGDTWVELTANLAAYSGTVYVAFKYADTGGYNLCIDDVTIAPEPTCPAPSAPVISGIASYTADVSWTESGSASASYIEYGAAGFTLGTGTVLTVTTGTDTTLAGLSAETDYDVYVQSYCGVGDLSTVEGPTSFTTLIACPKPTAPTTTLIGTDYATLGWTAGGTETLWHVEYGLTGFTPNNGEGTIVPDIATSSYNIVSPDLAYDTYYDWYVIADCNAAGDGISVLTGPTTFTTLISCPQPTAGVITNIMPTTADIGWTAGGIETAWNIEWGIAGFTHGSGTLVTTNPTGITGLTQNTAYEFYVQADCDGTTSYIDESRWSGPYAFRSGCATVTTYPWTEDFENTWVGTTPAPPCWKNINNNADAEFWERGTTEHTGSYAAEINTYYAGASDDLLITPELDFSAAIAGHSISFWVKAYGSSYAGELQVLLSTTDTAPASFTNVIMASTLISSTVYTEYTFNLDAYTGSVNYIAFVLNEATSIAYDFSIDDISITENPYIPLISIDPASKNFSTTAAGGSTGNETFTITNSGGGNLIINSGDLTLIGTDAGDFALTDANTYPISLGMGLSTTIDVLFAPTSAGDKTASINIIHNAVGTPTAIALTGKGLPLGALAESFEGTYLPDGWSTADGTWVQRAGGSDGVYHAGYFAGGGVYAAKIITPLLAIQSGDELGYSALNGYGSPAFQVMYSADLSTWTAIGPSTLVPGGTVWYDYTLDLTSLAGNNYYLAIAVTETSGWGATYGVDMVSGPVIVPDPPTNIVIANDGTNVTITWDAVTGATGYKVYSATDPNGTFTEDTSGVFTAEQWVAPTPAGNAFYKVSVIK